MWYYAPLTRQDDCIPGFGQRCDHTVHKLPRLAPDQSRRKRMQGAIVMASPITALCDSRGRVWDLHEKEEPHVLVKFIKGVWGM